MAVAQTCGIAATKAQSLGVSLPPWEPARLSHASRWRHRLGDALVLGVPPGDLDGVSLASCEKVQLSPLRHSPFLKKWHMGRPLGGGVQGLGHELRPRVGAAAATGFLVLVLAVLPVARLIVPLPETF